MGGPVWCIGLIAGVLWAKLLDVYNFITLTGYSTKLDGGRCPLRR